MAGARGTQRIGGRQWPILGLLLVASFLGHDLLMAAEAVATPLSAAGATHHAPASPAPVAAAAVVQLHGETPEHPDNCRIGQSAVPRSGDACGHVDRTEASAPGIVDTFAAPGVHAGAFRWEEPHWPPGTLRALCQVYRL